MHLTAETEFNNGTKEETVFKMDWSCLINDPSGKFNISVEKQVQCISTSKYTVVNKRWINYDQQAAMYA